MYRIRFKINTYSKFKTKGSRTYYLPNKCSRLTRQKTENLLLTIRVRALRRWGRVKGLRQGGGGHIVTNAVEMTGGGIFKAVF